MSITSSSFWETLFWPFVNLEKIASGDYIYLIPFGVSGYFLLKDGVPTSIPTNNIIIAGVAGTVSDLAVNAVESSKSQAKTGTSFASNRYLAYHNDWNSRNHYFY